MKYLIYWFVAVVFNLICYFGWFNANECDMKDYLKKPYHYVLYGLGFIIPVYGLTIFCALVLCIAFVAVPVLLIYGAGELLHYASTL